MHIAATADREHDYVNLIALTLGVTFLIWAAWDAFIDATQCSVFMESTGLSNDTQKIGNLSKNAKYDNLNL